MKKLLWASLAALVLALVLSTGAEARCNVTCLNHRVNALGTALIKAQKKIATQGQTIADLSQQVSAQTQTISGQGSAIKKVSSALACLFEAPLTEYGEPEGPFGYIFQYEDEEKKLETFPTTALDVTYPEDFVSGWALFDGCNTSEFATTASSRAIAPSGELREHLPMQARLP
ncbi:MAG: hypothetical protein ACJ75S_05555 [Solirubrobacterales bacterium]